ncbi:MAG: hypothetical protein JNL57_05475 [Bacteroidetes bacterium]|nr:hypothetical protein [Bacteroidota bacterium]
MAFLTLFVLSCSVKVKTEKDGVQILKAHKKIAVIPSRVTLEKRKGMPEEAIEGYQIQAGFDYQSIIYDYVQALYEKGQFTARIMDLDSVNQILTKAGYYKDTGFKHAPPGDVCRLLGVDGYILSSFYQIHPASKAMDLDTYVWTNTVPNSSSSHAHGGIGAWDGNAGKVMWNMKLSLNSYTGATAQEMVRYMMEKAVQRIPYVIVEP